MEFNTKDQPRGALYKLKSSFNEIFGKSETAPLGNKKARTEIGSTEYKKSEHLESN
ncbi:MAG: hypothetical protein PHF56_18465 [Desulfuromonadaceae bacterium]|nr:hypothetical protein [Desulfuromonadaceae bacterium]